MDLKLFATVFSTIFIAELGDKTQLATVLYASDAAHPKFTVFAASATALILTSALGVLAGSFVAEHVNPKTFAGPPASASSPSASGFCWPANRAPPNPKSK